MADEIGHRPAAFEIVGHAIDQFARERRTEHRAIHRLFAEMFDGLFRAHGSPHARSTQSAMPSPPPMQSEATPRLASRASIAASNVTSTRAPEAPMGCPSAQAPPLTFKLSNGMPSSRIAINGTTAKASLISQRSTPLTFQPARSSAFLIAGTGAEVNFDGCWA